jgi:predicted dehydrogenase
VTPKARPRGVNAALPHVAGHAWTAEDSDTVRFGLRSGVEGIMQSSASAWGPPVLLTRIAGTHGTVIVEGDTVLLSDRSGTRPVPVPDHLAPVPPDPPAADLMVTTYDLMHSTGIDLGPYPRRAETFRDRIQQRPIPDDPPPATFVDGVATMAVVDAIRRSAATRRWEWVPSPTETGETP